MSAQLEVYPDIDVPLSQPTIAEQYLTAIDMPNALREARQRSQITSQEFVHETRPFWVTTYMPTDGLRTWRDDEGKQVHYPHLLLAHGVASDARFFDSFYQKLNKLGIGCSAITLPKEHHVIFNGEELLEWQAGALVHAHNELREQLDNTQIILGGHSRGTIVAIHAKKQLRELQRDSEEAGLLLMAPAGLEKPTPRRFARAILNLTVLGFNTIRNTDTFREMGNIGLMLAENLTHNPEQTALEAVQALGYDVSHILYEDFVDVPVLITAAEHDEFIDHEQIMSLVKHAPHANISFASVSSNHLMGERASEDIVSLADPRLLTGQVLAWQQSRIPNYSPLSVRSDDGSVHRLVS